MSRVIITTIVWIIISILYFGEYYLFLYLLACVLGGAFAASIDKN
jgi:hypothetical protein